MDVTGTCYNDLIHDYGLLNASSQVPGVRSATLQGVPRVEEAPGVTKTANPGLHNPQLRKRNEHMAMNSIREEDIPLSFGAVYPTGHVVIFFADKGDAERAREALLTGGYEEGEIVILSSDYVVSAIEHIRPHVSLLAQFFGSETRHMEEHLELARQGCDKMVVYAPTEHETKRVMNVARRFGIRFAEKYHRLAIEHLVE